MIGREIHTRLHTFADSFRGNKKANDYLSLIRKMMKPYNVKVKKIIDKTNTAESIPLSAVFTIVTVIVIVK